MKKIISFIICCFLAGIFTPSASSADSRPWNPINGKEFCDNTEHANVCIHFQTNLPEDFQHLVDMYVEHSGSEYISGPGVVDKLYYFYLIPEPGVTEENISAVKIYYSYVRDFDRKNFVYRFYVDKVVWIYVVINKKTKRVYEDLSGLTKYER